MVLRDIVQMDYNEIAGHLDVPLGTVKSRIHDARTFVRQQLCDSAGTSVPHCAWLALIA